MNKQKDPSFKPHYWSLSIQTESAILRKCTRKIRNVGNSSMSTTIRCWLSVDLIKMFFFSCLYLQRSCRMYCIAFHLLRLFWWQLKDLCVQIFTSLYAECWQKSFSFASGLYFIQWRGFIGKKKSLLCSASCSWQSIHDKTSSRTQISAGGYCNKRHAEKKCLCAFSPLRQK